MRVLVVGNGIVALTTAYRLTRTLGPHDRIILVGPPARPGSATLAAAAMLHAFAERSARPDPSPLEHLHHTLALEARNAWPALAEEICTDADLNPNAAFTLGMGQGAFLLAFPHVDAADEDGLHAVARACEEADEPHAWVDPTEVPHHAPADGSRASRALHLPHEGWVNPRLLVDALDAALANSTMVHRVDGTVDRLLVVGGRATGVMLEEGPVVLADRVVLASGASASGVLEHSGLELRMPRVFYGVGVSVQLALLGRAQTTCLRTPNRVGGAGVYVTPYPLGPRQPANHVLVGATHHVGTHAVLDADTAAARTLVDDAAKQICSAYADAEVVRTNVGWRPTSQDGYPLVGPTSVDGLWLATGTKRDGLQWAPVLSRYVADGVAGAAVDERWAPFAPERAPIRSLTRGQGVAQCTRWLMRTRTTADEADVQHEVELIHDHAGALDWGIPPDLLEMYRQGAARG
jgi:glycine oxidase